MYALYKGEECMEVGTLYQIAQKYNIKLETLKYYGTNSYKRKLEKRKNSRKARVLININETEVWYEVINAYN